MRNILLLFARFGAHLAFIGLELFCFYLIVNYNQAQRDIWANSSNIFSSFLDKKVDNARDYFHLTEVNDSLQSENSRLLSRLLNGSDGPKTSSLDSNLTQYNLIPVDLCGLEIHQRYNYFRLCSGKKQGIRKGMGVITDRGVVGIVRHATNHFSTVLPLINGISRTSATIKGRNHPGTLVWQGSNPLKMKLLDIPKHAQINIGDTIVTSGYSTVYPKGITIGTIANFISDKGTATYEVDVNLWEDLTQIEYAYVVQNLFRNELDSLNLLLNEE